MFQGTLLPLSPDLPLSTLLAFARPAEPLGAWVRASIHRFRIYQLPHSTRTLVLASSNLGFLLGRCSQVAVREGDRTQVLSADAVIHRRALQVATATPHLPGINRLQTQFPGMRASVKGLLIPVRLQSPEEVLAWCVAEGVRVAGSHIVYTR